MFKNPKVKKIAKKTLLIILIAGLIFSIVAPVIPFLIGKY